MIRFKRRKRIDNMPYQPSEQGPKWEKLIGATHRSKCPACKAKFYAKII